MSTSTTCPLPEHNSTSDVAVTLSPFGLSLTEIDAITYPSPVLLGFADKDHTKMDADSKDAQVYESDTLEPDSGASACDEMGLNEWSLEGLQGGNWRDYNSFLLSYDSFFVKYVLPYCAPAEPAGHICGFTSLNPDWCKRSDYFTGETLNGEPKEADPEEGA
ncbi:hypothetical protein BGX38DRAFT_1174544 [Terfezia claveryi]|nr:hypothetical protein BGX38DRAFT_1174544 [Terfezia claveryi]